MSIFQSIRRTGSPGTISIIIVLVVFYLLQFMRITPGLDLLLLGGNLAHPWGAATYQIAAADGLLGFFLWLLWLYSMGGAVERDLGCQRYVVFFFAIGAVAGGAMMLTEVFTPYKTFFGGPLLPISAVTVAFGARNPNLQIKLFMCIPVAMKWVAWGTAVFVLLNYWHYDGPPIGLAACLHLVAAWAFATDRLPGLSYYANRAGKFEDRRFLKVQEKRSKDYYDDVKRREIDRAERERLRKLFEGSLGDDDKK